MVSVEEVPSRPDFTVVIPSYNRCGLIGETLESILAQHLPAAEIIVVDDGSTDETKAVVDRFGSRVIYRKIPSSGVQVARNIGIEMARTPWIALCDSDDLWRPDHLWLQADLIVRNPELDFVFSNCSFVVDGRWATEKKFDRTPAGFWDRLAFRGSGKGIVFTDTLVPASLFESNLVLVSALSLTKDLWSKVGQYNPALRYTKSEDWEFTLRCLYQAKVGAILEPTAGIRRHPQNGTASQAAVSFGDSTILGFVLRHHPQAARYRDRIEKEIAKRQAKAFDSAFAEIDHRLLREIYASLPAEERTAYRRLKQAVATLPDPLGRPTNRTLQTLREAVLALTQRTTAAKPRAR